MLFLYQETYYATPGLQDVIDKRVRSLHENHATNPACVACDWMRYLGDPITYLAFRLWSERDVTFDEGQLAFMSEYNRTRPPDAFIHGPEIEFFEQIAQAGETGKAGFLARSDLELAGRSSWREWEYELRKKLLAADGFHEYRLYRFMGGENRHVRAEFWQSQAAAEGFWHDPGLREFMSQLGQRPFRRAPRVGYYEVLHQTGDARMP